MNHSGQHLFGKRGRIRQLVSWRTSRWVFTAWFLFSSLGFPFVSASAAEKSCEQRPGQQCGCSLTKRMSGTCCCSRGSAPPRASCCSTNHAEAKKSPPAPSGCCTKKQLATPTSRCAVTAAKKGTVATTVGVSGDGSVQRARDSRSTDALKIQSCPCGSEAVGLLVINQQPRLSPRGFSIAKSELAFISIDLPIERWANVPSQPPVPPPKVLL